LWGAHYSKEYLSEEYPFSLRVQKKILGVSGVSAAAGRQKLYFRAASLIEDETFLEPENSFRMLWERFPTAMNSVGPPSKIVVGNHSHQALTSTEK
jgi:hypothetical protein